MANPTPSVSKKRKDPPPTQTPPNKKTKPNPQPNSNSKPHTKSKPAPRFQHHHRDARNLPAQTTSKAFTNGALDLSSFIQARDFEIRALEQAIQKSGNARNRRAFQLVPRELRRRTASHDVKRVPKRLRGRGRREMVEDNTPTVNSRTRKVSKRMRLRLEGVKRLRALGAKEKAKHDDEKYEKEEKSPTPSEKRSSGKITTATNTIQPRKAKPKLARPPTPKSKFRTRQRNKSWLPTHLFHAKRAHLTPPSAPLWRFAIPLTPTQKAYRPTHRATREKGAVAWDASYFGTIGIAGREGSVEGLLTGLGFDLRDDGDVNWLEGRRVRKFWARERESGDVIAPVEVIWCRPENRADVEDTKRKRQRRVFLRVHPAAFFQLWEETIRLAKVAKPAVMVEDLRFEIGSLAITGPGSTEALLSALQPVRQASQETFEEGSPETIFRDLAGLTNPALLPSGSLLAFNVQDPRLHYPPRTIALPQTQEELDKLVELAADWPLDKTITSLRAAPLFDRSARLRGSKLSSQKSINRRKALAPPGEYPPPVLTDPAIPILLYTSSQSQITPIPNKARSSKVGTTASWTLLAPWKTIQPIWYSLMHYPLSTGRQPRFGGLREMRQMCFEAGKPWFPGDVPGTKAGWEWELKERKERWEEWKRKPRGKRIAWDKIKLGEGRVGEVGKGWACDWSLLLGRDEGGSAPAEVKGNRVDNGEDAALNKVAEPEPSCSSPKPPNLTHLSSTQALRFLNPDSKTPPSNPSPPDLSTSLITVRLTLLTRGNPQPAARIYRLPSSIDQPALRKAWLALLPPKTTKSQTKKQKTSRLPPKDAPPHEIQRRLASELLSGQPQAGREDYPECPREEDLIGFVTTGGFNLVEGCGTGIGSVLAARVVGTESAGDGAVRERRLCVVRNSGEETGRLGVWEIVV